MAVHAKVTGQPHQWGQKVAQREASQPLPSHLPVTGSVPNLPLSSAPFFSVVGVWNVCRNLALLASTNFTGGEGDGHFQRWTKILFVWKMSGATRNEWRKLTAGFSLAVWAGRGWEMESCSCRYCFFFWGSSSVKKPLLLSFSRVQGKWGAVSLKKREGPWASYYPSSWEVHSLLLVSTFFPSLHTLFISCLVLWMEQKE